MPYFVYLLKSINTEKWYVGSTKDLEKRLKRHNQGSSIFTRKFRPWMLTNVEEYPTKTEALKHEYYLKSLKGYSELIEIKQKVRKIFFGGVA